MNYNTAENNTQEMLLAIFFCYFLHASGNEIRLQSSAKNVTGREFNLANEWSNKKDGNQTLFYKKALEQLNVTEETDLGIIRTLVSLYKRNHKNLSKNSNDQKLLILMSLEYLMNDIKNAREFHDLHGVQEIIFPAVQYTHPAFRKIAASLVAIAAINCPRIQMSALESGTLNFLLKAVLKDLDNEVRIHSMQAIASILKKYAEAQGIFVRHGGLSLLSTILEDPNENYMLLIKVISFLRETLVDNKVMMNIDMKSQKIYQAIGFEKAFLDQGWCSLIAKVLLKKELRTDGITKNNILTTEIKSMIETHKHDLVEEVCHTLLEMIDICQNDFTSLNLKTVVGQWKNWYHTLVADTHKQEDKERENEKLKARYFQITKVLEHLVRDLDTTSSRVEL